MCCFLPQRRRNRKPNIQSKACVFCGSRKGNNVEYENNARELGDSIASRQIGLVYGGGNVGLMGILADAVLENGGKVFGVIPKSLKDLEVAHKRLTELHVVNSMHERKKLMYDLSDAFVALPGGFGTLDEFCEILTWSQLGYHNKPIAFLNTAGYFNFLLQHFQYSVDEGFVDQNIHDHILVAENIESLFNEIKSRKSVS